LAFFLGAVSRHSALPLGPIAGVYLVLSLVLLWWRYSHLSALVGGSHGVRFFVECVVIAGVAFIILLAEFQYSEFVSRRRQEAVANAKVWNVRDETFFSEKGNPIGIRVSFSVQFPRSDYYGVSPWVTLPEGDTSVMHVVGVRQGEPSSTIPTWDTPFQYEAGRVYALVFDLVPTFIAPVSFEKLYHGERVFCLRVPDPAQMPTEHETFQKLTSSERRTKLKVRIADTPYQDQWTENEYSVKTFYDAFLKENPERCRF
jgi:hypothetical protein